MLLAWISAAITATAWIPQVIAHDIADEFTVDGVRYNASQGLKPRGSDVDAITWPTAAWTNTMFSEWVHQQPPPYTLFPESFNFTDIDLACGHGAVPGEITVEAPAGAHVTVELHWSFVHEGSFAYYMADCRGECQDVKYENLEWFKIAEEGLLHVNPDGTKNESSRMWGTHLHTGVTWSQIHKNKFKPPVTIPSTLAPGNYVLRLELFAIHYIDLGEVQLYPYCFNLKVTGSGTSKPKGMLVTDLYHPDEFAFSQEAKETKWYESYWTGELDPDPVFADNTSMIPDKEWINIGPPVWDGK